MTSIDKKVALRWGILGCGRTFVSNVKPLETAIFHACAARSLDKAEEFAKKHGNEFNFRANFQTTT